LTTLTTLPGDLDTSPLPEGEVSAHALRRPFWLEGLGRAKTGIGVLVVHGFSGTPFEMRPLGEALAAEGHTVYGPRLAGHCADSDSLARATWHDWLASVVEAFDLLRGRADRVYVAGLSLGGLLTLELARRRGAELFGISVLAAPIWLTRGAEIAIKLTRRLHLNPRLTLPKLAGSDVADPVMRRRNNLAQGTVGLPLPAVLSLRDFIDHVRGGLAEVRVPTLLVHAPQDHTAPYACMETLRRELGSVTIETMDAPRSYHVLPIDLDRDAIAAAVARHVERTATRNA
jgi:carboxylesterase